jgi:hypothetical protein
MKHWLINGISESCLDPLRQYARTPKQPERLLVETVFAGSVALIEDNLHHSHRN